MTANETYEKLKEVKSKYNICVGEIENQYKILKKYIENIDFYNKDRTFVDFFDDELTYLSNIMNSAKMYEEEFERNMMNENNKLENEIYIKEMNNDREITIDSEITEKESGLLLGNLALMKISPLFENENGFVGNANKEKTNLVRTVRLEDRTLEGTELLRRGLENQKDDEGNPLYSDEQIDRIVEYMQLNYKNQLDNLSVLNSYCGSEFEKLLNMCLEYSKDYDKILTDSEIRQLLLNCNWSESEITQDVIDDLQYTMKKYNINTQKEVCAFLTQCTFETGGGRNTIEIGDESYFNSTEYGSKYRGAGYIQLTWKYGYQAFVIYLVLREYPQLKECVEYKNPAYNSEEIIEDEYCLMVEEAKERGIDISHYTNIVDIGYSYLADNFAWESAGYFWDVNGINDLIEKGGTIDDVTTIVNRYDDTYSERESLYYTFIEYSAPMFE